MLLREKCFAFRVPLIFNYVIPGLLLSIVCCHKANATEQQHIYLPHVQQHHSTSEEPEFIGNIANLKLSIGKEAVMKCSVKNLGFYKVSWIHVDTQTVLTINEHVIERHSTIQIKTERNEHWYLIVKNVSLDDKGYYTCQISTKPPKFQIGYLEVVVPPQFDDSSLKSGTNVTVREHQNVTLSCKAKGNPTPEIKWTREDNQPILFTSNNENEVNEMIAEELNFIGVSRWATGAYLCSASNGVLPSITRRIMLVVHFPPMIRIPARLVTAQYGQNVTLVCATESNPVADHHWLLPSGKELDESVRNKYLVKTEKTYYFKTAFKLIIFQIDYSDYGNYACLVSNTFGEAKAAITLRDISYSLFACNGNKDAFAKLYIAFENVIEKTTRVAETLLTTSMDYESSTDIENTIPRIGPSLQTPQSHVEKTSTAINRADYFKSDIQTLILTLILVICLRKILCK